MLHARFRQRRTPMLLSALLALLLLGVPGGARPAGAANATIAVDPETLQISLPLGQSSTRTATITNLSSSALSPAIFEAYPPATPTALMNAHAGLLPQAVALPRQSSRLDTQLLADLQSAPDHQADFLIYMRDQADLSAASQISSWAERGRYVYQTLVDHAARSQHDLRSQLAARGLSAHPLWIVNAIRVHGTLADAQALSARADVALIRANHIASLPQPDRTSQATANICNPTQPSDLICWNIHQINADRVWRDFGISGHGVVVANIDTGVRYDHPALAAQYRGALDDGRYDHNYNWFDPAGEYQAPEDGNGHGTHTMGTIVASGAGGAPAVGVAPGAQWIAAQGCGSFSCNEADLIDAAQWILAPTRLDGGQPRPDLRPMIVNNSWAGTGGSDWYAGYTAAWRAAGIFPVFAAGNASGGSGQVCGSIESPGDYADVVAVGAADQNDTISGFSLLGPAKDGRRKPDFVAPGSYTGAGATGVLSTFPGQGASYQQLRGTSMAAPHVAGTVALLWSANPALIGDYDTTYALIRDSAHAHSDTRCGDAAGEPNNVYGYGRIDAYSAVTRARVNVPWLSVTASQQTIQPGGAASFTISVDAARVPEPGTYQARVQIYGADLTATPTTIDIVMTVTPASQQARLIGRVVSADTGAPVAATVGLKDGLGVQTNSSGVYTLTLAAGAYDLVASAPAFLPQTLHVQADADQQLPDIQMLLDQPRIAAATSLLTTSLALGTPQTLSFAISNSGTRPLHYHARALPDQYALLRSDEPGSPAYSWVDLPADAPTIKLADSEVKEEVPLGIRFPFYGYVLTDTLVTSDGAMAFSLPNQQYSGPTGRCFPTGEFHFFVIAPFRADLDPGQGGTIRYGTINNGTTFVLSYEQVPLHGDSSGATYTFQVLLHDDGQIVFQYHDLAALPASLSVGVQRTPDDTQAIGCGSATPIAGQLAITFRPQLNAATWLDVPIAEGEVLPSAQAAITATLQWARPLWPAVQRGRIEISSSDSLHPVIVLNIRAEMLPTPHEQLLVLVGNQL
jgi:subtilisin family serine protease